MKHLPDYKGGGIVNLMSSIASARGARTGYRSLKDLPPRELRDRENVVLITIDGLGYEYLKEWGEGSFMWENLLGRMTSVFPPTTASAMTTFYTGLPPQQHCVTGWSVYMKEYGAIMEPLLMRTHCGQVPLDGESFDMKKLLGRKSIFDRVKSESFLVIDNGLMGSKYTEITGGGARRLGYNNLRGLFIQVKKAINSSDRKKYIHAYWPKFDSIFHNKGRDSKKLEKHFKELDREIEAFDERIGRTDTALIITSDHGLIDAEEVDLDSDEELSKCLTLPLCGDARNAYCYVKPSKIMEFNKYVRNELGECCELYRSEELVENNYFGIKEPDGKLWDRIGDYTIIMKKNYGIKYGFKGHHGGTSKEEMYVPLIVKLN